VSRRRRRQHNGRWSRTISPERRTAFTTADKTGGKTSDSARLTTVVARRQSRTEGRINMYRNVFYLKPGYLTMDLTAATESIRALPVAGRCQSSATSIFQPAPSRRTTTSSQHARPSGVLRRRSDGLECAAWRPPETRRSVPSISGRRYLFRNALGHLAH